MKYWFRYKITYWNGHDEPYHTTGVLQADTYVDAMNQIVCNYDDDGVDKVELLEKIQEADKVLEISIAEQEEQKNDKDDLF